MTSAASTTGRASEILAELRGVIEEGFESKKLQRSPHLVLLDDDFYETRISPVVSRWLVLFLEAKHLPGVSSKMVEAYILQDGSHLAGVRFEAWVKTEATTRLRKQRSPFDFGAPLTKRTPGPLELLHAFMEKKLDVKSFKLLNLASDWLKTVRAPAS